MRVPRIHTLQPLQPHTTVTLEPPASQHLARALRMQAGDALVLFDGRGGQYPATISTIERKRVSVTITGHDPVEVDQNVDLLLCALGEGVAVVRRTHVSGQRLEPVPVISGVRS